MKSTSKTVLALTLAAAGIGLDAAQSRHGGGTLPAIRAMQTVYPMPDPDWGEEMPSDVVHEGCPVQWRPALGVSLYGLSETYYTFVYDKGYIMASPYSSNSGSYDFGDLRNRSPMSPKAILRGAHILDVLCWREEIPWLPDRHWVELIGPITARRLEEIPPATPYATTTNQVTANQTTYETWCKFLNEWSDTGMLISSEIIPGSCYVIQVT